MKRTPLSNNAALFLTLSVVFIYLAFWPTTLLAADTEKISLKKTVENLPQMIAGLKNPFIPKIPKPPPKPKAGRPVATLGDFNDQINVKRQDPGQPNFQISGLIWNTKRPQAIVNGQIVNLGDVVNGWSIQKITRNGIEVTSQEKTFFIEP